MPDVESPEFIDVWRRLGYASNPYTTEAVKPNAESRKFFVGRSSELELALGKLVNGARILTLEGDFGVGKTSLAATIQVDALAMADDGHQLFLTGARSLSVKSGTSPESFLNSVRQVLCETLLNHEKDLKQRGYTLAQAKRVRRRFESVEIASQSWSFSKMLGFSRTTGPNASEQFTESVLPRLLKQWLDSVFPEAGTGGVILHLDNLEDAGDVRAARSLMESLRDEIFGSHQVRWIISGADGFVSDALSGAKLAGFLSDPIAVEPMPHDQIRFLVRRRLDLLRLADDAKPPIPNDAFDAAYKWSGSNLRYALSIAEKFCVDHLSSHPEAAGVDSAFYAYLQRLASSAFDMKLGEADAKVLRILLYNFDGRCAPSEHAQFGYSSMPPLLTRFKSLATKDLIRYSTDKDDGRRRVASVTSRGRIWGLGDALNEFSKLGAGG